MSIGRRTDIINMGSAIILRIIFHIYISGFVLIVSANYSTSTTSRYGKYFLFSFEHTDTSFHRLSLSHFKKTDDVEVTTEISNSVRSVKEWSQVNVLKLNSTKTERIHISSPYGLSNPELTLNLLYCTLVYATKTEMWFVFIFDAIDTAQGFMMDISASTPGNVSGNTSSSTCRGLS